MYLKGSKWHLRKRRRRRSNPALIVLLLALIAAVLYFNQFVVEQLPVALNPTATATRNPESILQEAQQEYADGNLIRAIELYTQAIQVDPTSSTVYVDLARVQILAGQYEAAQTSASNALLLNPENPAAYSVLGWALSFIGDPLEAEQNLQRALELDPDNPEAQAYYAELLTDQGDYEQAGEMSRRAVELAPDSLVAHRSRGYVLWLTGNYEEAVVEYQRAIEINSSIADLHLSLGRVYWNLEEFQLALDEFALADSLNPSDPLPDTYISQIYLYLGEFAKAIQYAERALEEDPTNPRRYGNLGVAYYRNLQYDDAIEVFSYAVHGGTTPDNQAVIGLPLDYDVDHYFYMYGLSLARTRRCTEAIPIFQALLAAVPGDEIAIFNANEGISICEGYLDEPTPTPTVGEGTLLPTETIDSAVATETP
jgi:tetratricopeptide (TPR) repeat protein